MWRWIELKVGFGAFLGKLGVGYAVPRVLSGADPSHRVPIRRHCSCQKNSSRKAPRELRAILVKLRKGRFS